MGQFQNLAIENPADLRFGVSPKPLTTRAWLDRIQKAVEPIPASEGEFIGEMMGEVDTTKFAAADYGL